MGLQLSFKLDSPWYGSLGSQGTTICFGSIISFNISPKIEGSLSLKFTPFSTKGLNPTVFSESDLYTTITSGKEFMKYVTDISAVYVYAAGCGTETPKNKLTDLLEEIFSDAKVVVKEDIYAAAYAVTNGREGIVSILGTGSNCCYFDGKSSIISKIPSLGYMLMDDASGNYFGRILLRDYFYNIMPKKLHDMLKEEFNVFPDDVKLNLYQKPHPNAFLAKHATFLILDNIQSNIFTNPY